MEEAKRNRLILIIGTAIALVVAGFGYAALSNDNASAATVSYSDYHEQFLSEQAAFDQLTATIEESTETAENCAESVRDDGVCTDLESEIEAAQTIMPTREVTEGELEDYRDSLKASTDNEVKITETEMKLSGLNDVAAEAKKRYLEQLTVSQISMSEALSRAELAIEEAEDLLIRAEGQSDDEALDALREKTDKLSDVHGDLLELTKTDPTAYDEHGQNLLDLIAEVEDAMHEVRETSRDAANQTGTSGRQTDERPAPQPAPQQTGSSRPANPPAPAPQPAPQPQRPAPNPEPTQEQEKDPTPTPSPTTNPEPAQTTNPEPSTEPAPSEPAPAPGPPDEDLSGVPAS